MDQEDATGGVILTVVADLTETQRDLVAKLRAATEEFLPARDAYEERQRALHRAIEDALRGDVPPSIVTRESPYDRQHIGRIRDRANIPPRRPGTVVSRRLVQQSGDETATA